MNGVDAINWSEWVKVIYGIVLSTLMGFALGWINFKVIRRLFANANRQNANVFFRWAQIIAGAGVAFMHGAQDGQKFMGIFILAIMMAKMKMPMNFCPSWAPCMKATPAPAMI